jgi:uncharacterized membrane protein YcaP (DUF421 family)
MLATVPWGELFLPGVSLLEIVIRGSVMYLSIFLLLRIVLRRNMRQELITFEELASLLRKEGIEDLKEVKSAYMEPDGTISVIKASP